MYRIVPFNNNNNAGVSLPPSPSSSFVVTTTTRRPIPSPPLSLSLSHTHTHYTKPYYQAGDFRIVSTINIILVFFVSGLTLNTKEIHKAVHQWPGTIYGYITILGITPTLGFALRAIPFTPPEFAAGLAIFAAAPTTLGAGAALVRQARGNDALALLLLTGTNILSVFFMPLWLKALIGGEDGSSTTTSPAATDGSTTTTTSSEYTLSFSIGKMIWQLLITVLVPAIIGKVLRDFIPPIRSFSTKYKEYLSMFATTNLAMIVWQSLSSAQSLLVSQQFVNILYIIIATILQHAIYFALNIPIVYWALRMPAEEGVAVSIMGSQKSAPMAITAISYVTENVSTQGLLSVPCIIGQLVQIFAGAVYAPLIARKVAKIQGERKEEGEEDGVAVAVNGAGGNSTPTIDTSSSNIHMIDSSTVNDSDCIGGVYALQAGIGSGSTIQLTALENGMTVNMSSGGGDVGGGRHRNPIVR